MRVHAWHVSFCSSAKSLDLSKAEHTVMQLGLTHAELATLIGTSRPTVSIFLGQFEDEDIVMRSNGNLVILDPTALKAMIKN